jgi:zinc protease
VMDLIAEVLRKPSFPPAEFEALKQQELTKLEEERREPMAIAFQDAERHIKPFPKGDVRYVMTVDEQIEALKAAQLEEVKSFYRDFYGASRAELAIVGDVEPETAEKQISSLYAGWKSNQHYARVVTPFKAVDATTKSVETPDKANATFVAVQPVQMDDQHPDYPALLLANYMLGGGFLNSRLATRIRVKDGLSYGIGSQLQIPIKQDSGVFMTYAISAPQNTAKVQADFVEEMKRALDSGFTDQEIAAAKSGWLQSREVSRGQDDELTTRLANYAYWDRTMAFDARIESQVSALKAADVNAALRKYIDPAKISIFKAGDFSKATPAPARGTS